MISSGSFRVFFAVCLRIDISAKRLLSARNVSPLLVLSKLCVMWLLTWYELFITWDVGNVKVIEGDFLWVWKVGVVFTG